MSLEKDIVAVWDAIHRDLGEELLALCSEVLFFNTQVVTATPEGARAKIVEEALELQENPSLGERADVLITLLGELQLEGHSVDAVIQAARSKMWVNIHERTWEQQADGSWKHVRKDAA